LVYFKAGNLSIRTTDNNILIKPSGISYDVLSSKDLALVDINGRRLAGELSPSSETPMHIKIYRAFDHVKAIAHTHSENAIVCSITNTQLPSICNELIGFGGVIPLADYAIPGTEEIGNNAVRALTGPPKVTGVLLRNHGAITIGNTMSEACMRAELLEKMASIYIKAKTMGEIYPLSADQIQKIIAHYSSSKR